MSHTVGLFSADESPSDGFEESRLEICPRILSLPEVIRLSQQCRRPESIPDSRPPDFFSARGITKTTIFVA
jgi:hypothetical protein